MLLCLNYIDRMGKEHIYEEKIAILLSCVCIAFPALTYAQSNIQVKLDGSYVKFSGQEPTVINNRTMVPLRGIFENLGYSIEWDANTKTATLNKDNKSISIQTGADSFSVNGVGKIRCSSSDFKWLFNVTFKSYWRSSWTFCSMG